MNKGLVELFDKTEQLLSGFVAGCNQRTGMPCTAGHHCFCKIEAAEEQKLEPQNNAESMSLGYMSYQQPIQDAPAPSGEGGVGGGRQRGRSSMRMSLGGRMSIGGLGGLGRAFSLTSETTFGRAMSGLSALSIDWENMDDFDVNVDHSEGINNDIINGQQQQQGDMAPSATEGQDNGVGEYGEQQQGGEQQQRDPRVARRSSIRKNIPGMPVQNGGAASYNVSFNM